MTHPALQLNAHSTLTAQAELPTALPTPLREGQPIPDDIQWMPPGRQTLTPLVNGEPRQVTMLVDAALAARFAAQLQELRRRAAAGEADLPFLDFNHDDDAAAAEVLALYWAGDDPKRGGIRAKVRWSGAGRAALEGRNYRRFSPQWELDPDSLQPVGIRVNLGGLVNRAAFKGIQPVVAKDAGQTAGNKVNKLNTGEPMTREEFKTLLEESLKPVLDRLGALETRSAAAAKEGGPAAATAALDEKKLVLLVQEGNQALLEKMTTLELAQTDTRRAQAKAAIQAHVSRGAIAPEDTATLEFWTNAHIANAAAAEAQLARLPGRTLPRIINPTRDTATAAAPEEQFMARAKAFWTANKLEGGQAEILAAYGRSSEGRELYEQFRAKLHRK